MFINIDTDQGSFIRQRQKRHGVSTMTQRAIDDKLAFQVQERTDLIEQNRRMKEHILVINKVRTTISKPSEIAKQHQRRILDIL
jgi:hypothetical protein